MEKNRVLFEALEGRDELGTPKAACSLTIQRIISEEDTEVILSVGTQDAEVSVYSTPLWMIVDLRFEDRLDYDYLQFAQVCMEYLELANDSENELLSLVLSLTPLGEYNYFVTGVSGAWNFQPDTPDGEYNTIRFIFIKECFGVYELTDEAMEDMIEEAGLEMEFDERGHTYG